MAFDEEPDDPHGECRAEIERLQRVLDEGCNLDYEEGLLKDNARLRAEIARLNAESEARHQSCLVLMKSVTDHRAEIERLTADEREACAAVESARAWMREYGEEADRLRAALRAARPCVFNSRHGGWEEALRLVDEALREESRDG